MDSQHTTQNAGHTQRAAEYALAFLIFWSVRCRDTSLHLPDLSFYIQQWVEHILILSPDEKTYWTGLVRQLANVRFDWALLDAHSAIVLAWSSRKAHTESELLTLAYEIAQQYGISLETAQDIVHAGADRLP